MELLIIAIILTLAGAQESQLEGPENTLSIVGSTATLKCSSPSRNCSGIDWQKYVHGASPITILKGPSTILNTSVTDRNQYSVDNSSGCDLVIRNVQLTDAGRFICSAIVSSSHVTGTAYLIILETLPRCTPNVSLDDTAEGDGVQLNCAVSYNGTNGISMDWKGVTDAPAAVKNGNTINRRYSVVASEPEVPSFTCETSFTYEIHENGMPIIGLATNSIPNAICTTSTIKVIYSVRDVALSQSLSKYPPGTVITCAAKGHPPQTFKWQENENNGVWMDIQDQHGSKFTMTDLSSKRYRCVAMNVVRGKSYNATSQEILVNNIACPGIGFGIGLLVAFLLAAVVFAILVKVRCLEVLPRSTKKSQDGVAQHMDQQMTQMGHSSRQRSPRTGAPLTGGQDSAYASLGEDRDANEYASLEQ